MLLVKWLIETMGMKKCKEEPCIIRRMSNKQVSLMIGVQVDGTIMSGEEDICEAFFHELKER